MFATLALALTMAAVPATATAVRVTGEPSEEAWRATGPGDAFVQREPHAARIGIWDLKTNSPLLRLKADAEGHFVPVGDRVVQNPETVMAQQRQTNSCALALAAKDALSREPIQAAP